MSCIVHVQFSHADIKQLSLHTYLRFLRAYKAKICCCVALLFDDSTAVAVTAEIVSTRACRLSR